MTFATAGFDGNMTEAQLARLQFLVTDDVVSGLAPSPGGGTRVINLTAGSVVGAGVLAETAITESVTFDANTSGTQSRIDLLVAQYTWSTNVVIPTFKKGAVSATPVAPDPTQTPGSVYQVTLAKILVRPSVSTFLTSDITAAPQGRPRVRLYRDTPTVGSSMAAGATNPQTISTITVPDQFRQVRARISAQQSFEASGISAGYGKILVTQNTVVLAEAEGRTPTQVGGPARLYHVTAPFAGEQVFRLQMVPGGNFTGGPLVTSASYSSFSVEVEPV